LTIVSRAMLFMPLMLSENQLSPSAQALKAF
jgi:hypothetical protein